jgi:CRP-like cAMP-binding protein
MSATQSLFLAALSEPSRNLLLAHCTSIDLPLKTSLYTTQQEPRYAYFITSGLASLVVSMSSGETAEVGIVGREGIVGSMHLLGPAPLPTDCMMQLGGTGLRIPLHDLKNAFNTSLEIRRLILEMTQEQVLSLSQIAGCNRLHEAEPRLARWLLMTQDRTQCDVLGFTQEFLANMLGAQRTTVTLIAGELHRRGLIEYSRGKVRILDRAGLESAACDCYQILKSLYCNLYKRADSAASSRIVDIAPPADKADMAFLR